MELIKTRERGAVEAADGSLVRELAHPDWSEAKGQSLAEAMVPPGTATREHLHVRSEEIYCFVAGGGRIIVGGEERPVVAGDCVVIPPGSPHKLVNDGEAPMVLLCACSPAYSEADTELLE